uniref:Olfactory receptor 75 n=1 Tax=Aulacocentrum confusum TaxID=2767324 RepID=A0A7G8Z994_9HYME|nr:olfactory receptor 75 [Aulacocentrum confusum]
MQMDDHQVDFQIYGPRVFTLLSGAMILENNHITKCRKLLSLFITGSCIVMGLALITTEILDTKHIYDLQSFAERLNPIFFHILGIYKWISAIMKFDDLQVLINMIKNSHKHFSRIDEDDKGNKHYKQKIENFKKKMSWFALIWLCICSCGIIQWCSTAIIYDFHNRFTAGKAVNASSRHLPYFGLFPWNINTKTKYIATFAFQLLSGYQTSMGHAIFEILYLTILATGCLHLEYLNECMTNEKCYSLDSSDRYYVDEKFYRKIKNCMISHQSILEYKLTTIYGKNQYT